MCKEEVWEFACHPLEVALQASGACIVTTVQTSGICMFVVPEGEKNGVCWQLVFECGFAQIVKGSMLRERFDLCLSRVHETTSCW